MTLLIKICVLGFQDALFFTRYCYYFFHKPEITVMDFNVHIGSVLVTKEQAESPNGNLKLFNTLDPEKHLNT